MGKGDQRSRRGKLYRGTHGKRRPKNRELTASAGTRKTTARLKARTAATAAKRSGGAGGAGSGAGAAGGAGAGGGATA